MSESPWKNYFDQKASTHGASVKSSDYFDDASFFAQRDRLLEWLGPQTGRLILDAGCGVGAFSEPWTRDNTVYGVDFSEKSLEYAAGRGLKTLAGDLTALPFAAGMFDLVVCIGVIQLMADCRPVLAELARIVKPGGTLLVQTLHKGSLQRKLLGLWERRKKFDKMYEMAELSAWFRQLGLGEISYLKQYHPLAMVATSRSAASLTDCFCTSFAIRGVKTGG